MAKKKIEYSQLLKKEYDISKAFKDMELQLIADFILELKNNAPTLADKECRLWYLKQMQMLEKYRLTHKELFDNRFNKLNEEMADLIKEMKKAGASAEEMRIIKAVELGYKTQKVQPTFITQNINEKKLNALINATTNDVKKAELAILRTTDDEFRKILFDAQVNLNTGSMSYTQAIDSATKSLLENGIQCVKYKNGAKHQLSDYCDMALKTANMRAYFQGEGEKRQEYGLHLVLVGQRSGSPCRCCLPYIGKILVDDVYSGGTAEEARKYGYTLLSEAIANGLYHPRCKDSHTTYFPNITKLRDAVTEKEYGEIISKKKDAEMMAYLEREKERYFRLSEYSICDENKVEYAEKYKRVVDRINNLKRG